MIGLLTILASPVSAEVATLDVLLDVDHDSSTGCDLMTVDGLAQGVETRIRTIYDVGTQNILSTTYADCLDPVVGLFSNESAVGSSPAPPWAGVVGNGTAGSTLIESHIPATALTPIGTIRAMVVVNSVLGEDTMLTGDTGTPLLMQATILYVPSLTPAGLLTLACLSLLIGWLVSRTKRFQKNNLSVLSSTMILILASLFIPANGRALLGEGTQRTWVEQEKLATDPEADAPIGIDLLAFYSFVDPTSNELWLRLDVLFGTPVCVGWGHVDPGMGFPCSQEPPPDPGPFAGQIALTFDDGPNPAATPSILATLRLNNIPATFFVQGNRLINDDQKALAFEMHQDPLFRVANHSNTHPRFNTLTPQQMEDELLTTSDRIRDAIADACYFPRYFRFPYSISTCNAMEIARSHGHAVVGVNMAPADWCYALGNGICPAAVIPTMPEEFRDDLPGLAVSLFQASGGGIMLLHDLHPNTAAELPAIISALQAAGATFVDLDDPLVFPLLNASIVPLEPPACCEGVVSQ